MLKSSGRRTKDRRTSTIKKYSKCRQPMIEKLHRFRPNNLRTRLKCKNSSSSAKDRSKRSFRPFDMSSSILKRQDNSKINKNYKSLESNYNSNIKKPSMHLSMNMM